MNSVIIILFCIITAIIHYKFFSILKSSKETPFFKARLLFCIVTAGLWALKILLSSLPASFYYFFIEGRTILRLSRVFLYTIVLLTDYTKLRAFLTKYRLLLFILCPLISLFTLEISIGTNLFAINAIFLLCSLLFLILFYLFFYLLTGNASASLVFCSLCLLILSVGNSIVYQFRGRYISYSDIYELTAAAAVAGKYKITFHLGVLIAILLFLLSLSIIILTSQNRLKVIPQKFLYRIPLCILILAGSILLVRSGLIFNHIESRPWDPVKTEKTYGYLLSALAEIHDSKTSAPEGYSPEKISEILDAFQTTDASSSNEKPDIIVIMNESFSDLSVLGNFETNQNPIPYYHSLSDNCQKGYIIASGIGGGTSYTEFEALSGCSQAFIQGSAYARYIHQDIPSLVSTLKSPLNGYSTIAIHPEKAANYYRDRAYRFLGFNESFFIDSFENSETIFDKVTDSANYKFLIEKYEEMIQTQKTVFLFNVTMQNHGDYTHTDYTFDIPISVTSFDAGSDVDEFLSLTKMSDDALKELIDYFKSIDRPVLLLFFGDHQPTLNKNFYETVFQKQESELTAEEELKKHITPFMIWANYEIEEKEFGILSPNQLSPLLLNAAGITPTAFQNYIQNLSKTLPVIQSMGYMDQNGHFYTYDEESPYTDLISEYNMIQYNYLHDKNMRLDQYYYLN